MPQPSKVAWDNLVTGSGVTITASSEATGHADDHLASPARWKTWRSATGTSEVTVEIDLGSIQTCDAFGVVDAVLFAGGDLKVETKTTSGGSYVVQGTFSFPSFNPTGVSMLWATVAARYVLLRFTNPDSVSASVQLGVAFVAGSVLTARAPVAPGAAFTRIDPSVQRRAIGGARSAVVRTKFHSYEGVFHLASVTERDAYATMFDTIGSTDPCVLAIDPDTPQLVAYGVLEGFQAQHHVGSVDRFDLPYRFTEDVA